MYWSFQNQKVPVEKEDVESIFECINADELYVYTNGFSTDGIIYKLNKQNSQMETISNHIQFNKKKKLFIGIIHYPKHHHNISHEFIVSPKIIDLIIIIRNHQTCFHWMKPFSLFMIENKNNIFETS